MKNFNPLLMVSAIALTSTALMAQVQDQNKDRPGTTAQPATRSENYPPNQMSQDMIKKMDAQMKAMQEIHQKMINAKTPEERNAIMADNRRAMESGMSMMREAGSMGMPTRDGMPMMGDIPINNQMMQIRMEMMTNMMQMMMDRLNSPQGK